MSEQRHAALGIHGLHTHPEDQQAAANSAHHPQRSQILRRARLVSFSLIGVLLAGAAATLLLRSERAQALAEASGKQANVFVNTIKPKALNEQAGTVLPGSLQGMIEAPIYARTSGYVLRWNKDIGSQVKKGDILAELDTPDVDQQLAQALAARDQAAASLELARSTAERWEALRRQDAVTQQELQERSSAFEQAKANLAASDANVRRLRSLQDFKHITAPFSGVITRRNIEPGDLIDAGNGGAAKALFTLSQTDNLRVYIYVPQAYAQKIRIGDSVQISQKENPSARVSGKIVRTAGAIDPVSRTLQAEINLANPGQQLLAGTYVDVSLPALAGAAATARYGVPSNVILFRPEGTTVASVDSSGKVHLQQVRVGNDFGNQLEIIEGLNGSEQLVLNPPDSIANGDQLSVRPAQPAAAGESKNATPAAAARAAS